MGWGALTSGRAPPVPTELEAPTLHPFRFVQVRGRGRGRGGGRGRGTQGEGESGGGKGKGEGEGLQGRGKGKVGPTLNSCFDSDLSAKSAATLNAAGSPFADRHVQKG